MATFGRTRRRAWRVLPGVVLLLAGAARADEQRWVEGTVTDAATGAAVTGALVRAGTAEERTDAEGRFRRLAVEGPTLEVWALGYRPFRLPAGEAQGRSLEIALLPDRPFQEEVEVTATAAPAARPSTEVIGPERVLQAAGTADNVFRLLRTLPGIAATEDLGSRLSVRGGGPDQNLTVMDGVEVHNPYRLFGLTAAFNPETVERFELTAGAFSAKYGDRLSSLLVVENRAGSTERAFTGSTTVALTDANLIAEGRLPRARDGSWLVTTRRTYYDLVAERFVENDLPGFFDVQGQLQWSPASGHRVRIQALRSRENSQARVKGYFQGEGTEVETSAESDLASVGVASTLGSALHLTTTAAWSSNRDTLDLEGRIDTGLRRSNAPDDEGVRLSHADFDRDFSVRDASLRQELAWGASPRHVIETGYEWHRLDTRVSFVIRGDRNPLAANGTSVLGGAGLPDGLDSRSRGGRFGAWLQDRATLTDRLTADLGLRLDRSGLTGEPSWQPRVGLSFRLGRDARLRAAFGLYAQTPGYEKLYQGDYFLDLTQSRALGLRNQRAWHGLAGYERPLGGGVTARVEAYYRRFDRLVEGRLESAADLAARLDAYDFPADLSDSLPADPVVTTWPTNDGRGQSYGIDAYLERRAVPGGRWSGWLSYTWGVASHRSYGRTYPFEYDRRHSVSLVAMKRFGERFEFSTTLRAASGFPRTPPLGLRVAAAVDVLDQDGDGDAAELVPERDGEGRLVYEPSFGGVGNFGSGRLPPFARLDLRLTFFPRGRRGRWQVYADVINALDRRNAEFLQPKLEHDPDGERPRMREEPSRSIGILPSVGVRFRF
jgi:hypothetical protein